MLTMLLSAEQSSSTCTRMARFPSTAVRPLPRPRGSRPPRACATRSRPARTPRRRSDITRAWIGRLHSLSDTAIRKRAKANGWTRDLSGAVRTRVRESLVCEGVRANLLAGVTLGVGPGAVVRCRAGASGPPRPRAVGERPSMRCNGSQRGRSLDLHASRAGCPAQSRSRGLAMSRATEVPLHHLRTRRLPLGLTEAFCRVWVCFLMMSLMVLSGCGLIGKHEQTRNETSEGRDKANLWHRSINH
jgi:hypothetical protein